MTDTAEPPKLSRAYKSSPGRAPANMELRSGVRGSVAVDQRVARHVETSRIGIENLVGKSDGRTNVEVVCKAVERYSPDTIAWS